MSIPAGATALLFAGADTGTPTPSPTEELRSLRFHSADSAYLSRTPSSAGNRKTFTWSGWLKQVVVSGTAQTHIFAAGTSPYFQFYFAGPTLYVETNQGYIQPTRKFRDPSAWFHFVVAVDTTQATATNRIKLYVNGEEVTDFAVDQRSSITQNTDLSINSTVEHRIGRQTAATAYSNMYLSRVHFVDGQQLEPTDFGEFDTNEDWQPITFAGTSYGTNGFKLTFGDNSSLANLAQDTSGNDNDFTANNISITAGSGNDSVKDHPEAGTETDTGAGDEVAGNYATLNPAHIYASTLSNGALDWTSSTNYGKAQGTIAVTSGKWYYEATIGSGNMLVGIFDATQKIPANTWIGTKAYYSSNGRKYDGNSATSYGSTFTSGDVIGVALDMDAGTLVFYKNNVSQGTAFTGITGRQILGLLGSDGSTGNASVNFGQREFTYNAPNNFKAVCATNLPSPTLTNPRTAFKAFEYTGNGSSQTINVGFDPDVVWFKQRGTTQHHLLCNTIRGATKQLLPNLINTESTDAQNLNSYVSNGFLVGSGHTVNENGQKHMAYCWELGSSNVSNTDGSLTSTIRANQDLGCSIIQYTGNGTSTPKTVGHGLGQTPKMVIWKKVSESGDWIVYHDAVTTNGQTIIRLQSNIARQFFTTSSYLFANSTQVELNWPTTSVLNKNGVVHFVMCFAPVEGVCSIGRYVGNGNATVGVFVHCGFRPAWILIKRIAATGEWRIHDSTRSPFNVSDKSFAINTAAELSASSQNIDILSNGFKILTANSDYNDSGDAYLYTAMAESPFKTARAR